MNLIKNVIMHEINIVLSVVKSVKEIAKEYKISHLNSVLLEVGGYDLNLDILNECFKSLTQREQLFLDTKLYVKFNKFSYLCNFCGTEFLSNEEEFFCHNCKSKNITKSINKKVVIKEIDY